MSETIYETDLINPKLKKDSGGSPNFILFVLSLGVFITALASFVFSPALPTIASSLHTSLDMVTWVVTIYILLLAAITPLSGKLSDKFGRKKIYIAGVAIFTIGSIACGFSWDIYSLIAFRGLQAIGAALVLPAAIAEVGTSSKENAGKMMGLLLAMSAFAMIIGPNLGGYLIQNFGWRTIFYFNIPIGILAILLCAWKFKENYGKVEKHLDVVGSLLLTGAVATVLLGFDRFATLPIQNVTVYPLFIAFVLLTTLFVLVERSVKDPIIDIPLLVRGDVLSLNLTMLLMMIPMFCTVIYIPSFVQEVLHLSVQYSGFLVTPLAVALLVGNILGGAYIDRYDARSLLLIGSLIVSCAFIWLTYFVSDWFSLIFTLIGVGLGLGFALESLQLIMLSHMPEGQKGAGTGIINTFKYIGSAIGSVIGAIFLVGATTTLAYNAAFKNIFLFGTLASMISVLLVVFIILLYRTDKYHINSQVLE